MFGMMIRVANKIAANEGTLTFSPRSSEARDTNPERYSREEVGRKLVVPSDIDIGVINSNDQSYFHRS
jgi:hypothetical protein